MEKILLVDDENDILEFLSYNLKQEGYQIFTATNGKAAIEIAKSEKPELIVLDVMMPEMDGVETCIEIRKYPELKNSFIVFLTARSEDYSQIAGLEAGADDYLTKPIKPRVFVSKIKALFRRKDIGTPQQAPSSTGNGIKIDRERYLVTKDGAEFSLPKKEFELLALLISKKGKVFTRQEILEKIWGEDVIVGDRTIDVHIRKLREKLGNEYIKTVKGVGYKFKE
ncbi:MAG: response regulator transcription factor [Flavobacteriales bacterium]|nr:response regulator transcription factor [Flavobacteriales bacterium]